jgi:hypothetical protein
MHVFPSLGALTVALAVLVEGQSLPNFTGTWMLPAPRTAAGVTPPMVVTIQQNEATLTQTTGRNVLKFTLDGNETINSMLSNDGVIELRCHTRWEADKLVIEMRSESRGVRTQILSLSADGKELNVENVTLDPQGERRGTLTFIKQ